MYESPGAGEHRVRRVSKATCSAAAANDWFDLSAGSSRRRTRPSRRSREDRPTPGCHSRRHVAPGIRAPRVETRSASAESLPRSGSRGRGGGPARTGGRHVDTNLSRDPVHPSHLDTRRHVGIPRKLPTYVPPGRLVGVGVDHDGAASGGACGVVPIQAIPAPGPWRRSCWSAAGRRPT